MTSTVKGEQVGAWWLGYPVLASISLLLGTCTLWFPDWFVVPVWLKRRRFKKRLLRYRRKKKVISRKRRKEQLKRLNKAKNNKKKSKRPRDCSGSNDRERNRSQNRQNSSGNERRNQSQSGNPSGRANGNRTSDENERQDTPPHYSRSNNNVASESVPDLVAAHNGALPAGNAQRESHHSEASADSNPPEADFC